MKIEPRNVGRFVLQNVFFEQGWENLIPVFANMVILEARSSIPVDGIEYVALSPAFKPILRGDPIPLYRVEAMRDMEGKVTDVFWFRVA